MEKFNIFLTELGVLLFLWMKYAGQCAKGHLGAAIPSPGYD
jgi:hypothetical protein